MHFEENLVFTNNGLRAFSVILVLPARRMSNRLRGVLIGQRCLLDVVEYKITPRTILIARGHKIKDYHWGDIDVEAFVDQHSMNSELRESNHPKPDSSPLSLR